MSLGWTSVHAAPDLADAGRAPANTPTLRFENQVRLYEAADASNAPPRNAILLVGDSQFYRWKTAAEDLWVADGVHPNHAGYRLGVKLMLPLLGKPENKIQ